MLQPVVGPTLLTTTAIGTVLQVAMVVAGHYTPSVARLFAVGGMLISLTAGLLYGYLAAELPIGPAALGGLIAGGACALVGILVSYVLRDVPAAVLAFGTVSSAVTGAVGAVIARAIA